jgi:hypothetical protein
MIRTMVDDDAFTCSGRIADSAHDDSGLAAQSSRVRDPSRWAYRGYPAR